MSGRRGLRELTEAEVLTWCCVVGCIRDQRIRGDALKPVDQPRAIRQITGLYPRFGWVEPKGSRP